MYRISTSSASGSLASHSVVGRWSGGEHAARHGIYDKARYTYRDTLLDEGTHRVQEALFMQLVNEE